MALRIEDLGESDQRDVERFQAGELDAFDDLYRRHRDRLQRYCRYRLGNEDEAEDVVQETFSRAWRSLPAFGGDRRFYPWLRVIASNLCTDALRRRNRTEVRAEIDPGPAADSFEALYRDVDAALVRSAFGRLKNRHRDALHLREWEELSYEEIASRVGVSIGTVESLLWRARQALKRELQSVTGGEGVLVALPVIGVVFRRLRSLRARLAGRLPGGAGASGGGMAAIGAVISAGVVAAVVAGGSAAAPTGGVARHHPADQTTISRPAALVSGAGGAGAPTDGASGFAGGAVGPRSALPGYHVVNPVSVSSAGAHNEARSDPVHAAVGPAYLGVDPAWTAGYAVGTASGISSSTTQALRPAKPTPPGPDVRTGH